MGRDADEFLTCAGGLIWIMQHGNQNDLGLVAAIPARNTTVDFLRAVSVIWIVGFWHLIGYSPIREVGKNAVTLMATVAALGLFVLLSGYLQGGRGRNLFDFYRRDFGGFAYHSLELA